MSIRLSGALPDGDRNGLGSLAHALVEHPDKVHVAVVLVDAASLKTNVDTGDVVPTVRIRAIEPITRHETDATEMERLMRRAYERRTGQEELPLELEREIDELSVSLLDDDADNTAEHNADDSSE